MGKWGCCRSSLLYFSLLRFALLPSHLHDDRGRSMLKKAPCEGLLTFQSMIETRYNTPDCALVSSRKLQLDGEKWAESGGAYFVSTCTSISIRSPKVPRCPKRSLNSVTVFFKALKDKRKAPCHEEERQLLRSMYFILS